jgi:hypothetical protein
MEPERSYIIPSLKSLSSLVHVNMRGDLTQFFYFFYPPCPYRYLEPPPPLAPMFTNHIVHLVSSITSAFNQLSSMSILRSEDSHYTRYGCHHVAYIFTCKLLYLDFAMIYAFLVRLYIGGIFV